ncbi:hypothetical protein AB0F92_24790 [Kitasatospora aureofaciens]|uniref:hypothetical protein n=1 Tax=Kitasatospora aureofaciens TaxID=1894 RepID=UPI0033FFE4B7
MQQAVHFDAIFQNSPGDRHVQVRMNGNVVFNDTLEGQGSVKGMDITEPIVDTTHIELGIVTDDGAFHACRYTDIPTFGGPPPFELVLPDSGLFPPSPAHFDTAATTGLPAFGGGTFELFYEESIV